jgi:dolichol-phosphate mannosyltransferase
VQAAQLRLRVKEVGVPRLYLDPNRAFGGVLNDADERLAYYRGVIAAAEDQVRAAECGARGCHSALPVPHAVFSKGTCR